MYNDITYFPRYAVRAPVLTMTASGRQTNWTSPTVDSVVDSVVDSGW